jgi:hypothetical protein
LPLMDLTVPVLRETVALLCVSCAINGELMNTIEPVTVAASSNTSLMLFILNASIKSNVIPEHTQPQFSSKPGKFRRKHESRGGQIRLCFPKPSTMNEYS